MQLKMIKLFTSWFGLGWLRGPTGTYGTAGAIPLYYIMTKLAPMPYLVITIVLTVLAIFAADYQERTTGTHDSGAIVIDEVIGFLLTMFLVPFSWFNVLLGFILFRAFDIIKPPPVRMIDEKLPGGYGVVLDDALAGIYACIVLHLILIII